MAWYDDLAACDYFGPAFAPRLKAVGWLDAGRPYARGRAEPRFLLKLVLLFAESWEHERPVDPHRCALCVHTGGPAEFRLLNSPGMPAVPLGNRNLYVPADGFLYVAPSLALHYADAHEYVPPAPFVEAVLACPPVRSKEYLEAVRRHAPAGFVP